MIVLGDGMFGRQRASPSLGEISGSFGEMKNEDLFLGICGGGFVK